MIFNKSHRIMRRFFHILTTVSAAALCLLSCSKGNEMTPGRGENGGGNGGSDSGDKPTTYEVIENTFDYGEMQFYGVYYDNQPEDVNSWSLVLAEDSFDLIEWTGTGYCAVVELFTDASATTDIPGGKYTVEAFLEKEYAKMSVGDGYVFEEEGEDGETLEYCGGTWLYEDGYGIAGATSGDFTIAKNSNGTYLVTYDFKDSYNMIHFKGSYTGELEYYDGTDAGEVDSKSSAALGGRRVFRLKATK